MVIPVLLRAFEVGIRENDYPKIKGAMYSLIFGSLARTVSKDWRYTPRLIKAYLAASDADKESIQKLATSATLQIMDFGRPTERAVILDRYVNSSLVFFVLFFESQRIHCLIRYCNDWACWPPFLIPDDVKKKRTYYFLIKPFQVEKEAERHLQ